MGNTKGTSNEHTKSQQAGGRSDDSGGTGMKAKLREPSEADLANAAKWLTAAQHNLSKREFHRVKQLCAQVTRVLRRKESESQ